MISITPRTFYKVGIFCFIAIALATLGDLWIQWIGLNWFGRSQRLFFFGFYSATTCMFNYMLSITPDYKAIAGSEDEPSLADEFKGVVKAK